MSKIGQEAAALMYDDMGEPKVYDRTAAVIARDIVDNTEILAGEAFAIGSTIHSIQGEISLLESMNDKLPSVKADIVFLANKLSALAESINE